MDKDNIAYNIWLSEKVHHHNDVTMEKAEQIYDQCRRRGIKVISFESDEFPDSLRIIKDPPRILFCIGDLALLKNPAVAVVGTRRTSAYGRWIAREIGKTVASCGITHVSGMAEGIDSVGHAAVLENGGKSIAVLGTGVDVCFPYSSKKIYEELKEKGLIISEYVPGTSGYPANFPERNRLISALAVKVVIVEGALKSGSLITARIALEQGKDIYAVPGNINQPNSIGPNLLISDGAVPIADPNEIAETLGIGSIKKYLAQAKLKGREKELYELVRADGEIAIDSVCRKMTCATDVLISTLTALELEGLVESSGGMIRLK